jgi:hypothetical protein
MAVTGYFIDADWKYHEVLLGFEPIHGTHSGANLSITLLKILEHHQIQDRILTITRDNASNNTTLIQNIQDSLQSLQSDHQIPVTRIPCIAHVIQLCLKQLLGQIKANPKNETTERVSSDSQSQSLKSQHKNGEIAYTLNLVCSNF